MSIKIIDSKKIEMTQDEWNLYIQICRSYDRQNFKGEELFKELFESDNDGIITFIRPPSNRYTSMEVFLFMVTIMNHQNIRLMQSKFDKVYGDIVGKLAEVNEKLKVLKDVEIKCEIPIDM